MGATALLLEERAALCATFDRVGAEAPTLCEGWDASDLAAHLLVRETRPDAAIGIVLPGPFATHMRSVMQHAKRRGFKAMVDALRTGPPWLFRSGPMASVNLVENWVHHEDLRRAQGDAPRPANASVDDALWNWLGTFGKLAARRVHGAGLEVRTSDGRTRALKSGEPNVVLTGAPGELVLFMSGRKEAAVVEHEGPPEAVALVVAAPFGL